MRPPALPFRRTSSITRALRRRADAARDAQAWLVAGALYEEALALGRPDGALHVQCGHMFKEAGDFARAERHYEAATALLPDDADLALQLGHFHKTANEPARAQAAYARALALRPGWPEAAEELRLLAGSAPRADGEGEPAILPELLPAAAAPPDLRERLVVHRLGAELAHGSTGTWRVLRGIQAIRGWCRSSEPIAAVALLVDGTEVQRAAPVVVAGEAAKHVFNLWHDFAGLPVGEAQVEVRAIGRHGRTRSYRAACLIAPPRDDPAARASDAWLPPLPAGERVADFIDALPSSVRPAARALLPASPGAVLVQRVDQLGDLVCSVAAIRRLRRLFPHATLVGLMSPANADLARSLDLFDQVMVADFAERDGRRAMDAEAQRLLTRALAPFRFDVAIDLSENGDSRPLLLLSGARFLVGFGPRRFPWLDVGVELAAPDPLDRLEAAAHGRTLDALVAALGALVAGPPPVVPRPPDPTDAERRMAHGIAPGRPYLLLHTGARLAFSRWPGFAALAQLLLEHTRLDVVVMHDGDDAPAGLPRDPRLHLIGGRVAFDAFDALLAGAAAFVGNDSGPKHLAALRGTPVVSLHMARLNWNEWGQEQGGVIVSRRVPCAGCGIATQPDECGRDFACLRLIRPEEVLAAVLSLLSG